MDIIQHYIVTASSPEPVLIESKGLLYTSITDDCNITFAILKNNNNRYNLIHLLSGKPISLVYDFPTIGKATDYIDELADELNSVCKVIELKYDKLDDNDKHTLCYKKNFELFNLN
jgi:hypothetical protein